MRPWIKIAFVWAGAAVNFWAAFLGREMVKDRQSYAIFTISFLSFVVIMCIRITKQIREHYRNRAGSPY